FNEGDPEVRARVNHALMLWLDAAFAGIPQPNRPPVLVTTHTHTGRMEVNLLIPRWVLRADGKIRAYNPDPPGAAHRALREGIEDLLNHRFGWADPRDPLRRHLVHLPDWELKDRAAASQRGEDIDMTPRAALLSRIRQAVIAKELQNRDQVVSWLRANGQAIHRVGKSHITLGDEEATPSERMRLTGPIFSEDFTSLPALIPQGAAKEKVIQKRLKQIKSSLLRLPELWQQRTEFNRSRYGLFRWPRLTLNVGRWLTGPLNTLQIPPFRLDRPIPVERTYHAAPAVTLSDGAPIVGTPDRIGFGDFAAAGRISKSSGTDRGNLADPIPPIGSLEPASAGADTLVNGNPDRPRRIDLIRQHLWQSEESAEPECATRQ
ncbi:MAG: hypothetical protein VX974_18075, partial [Pseudomonadota bacterium]|nr:hypothetical protein [Pseudomonadota bacterium]